MQVEWHKPSEELPDLGKVVEFRTPDGIKTGRMITIRYGIRQFEATDYSLYNLGEVIEWRYVTMEWRYVDDVHAE